MYFCMVVSNLSSDILCASPMKGLVTVFEGSVFAWFHVVKPFSASGF